MPQENLAQAIDTGLRASPPITVTAASFLGLPLEQWVYLFTLIYTVVQLGYTVWTWKNEHKKRKEARNGKSDNRTGGGPAK